MIGNRAPIPFFSLCLGLVVQQASFFDGLALDRLPSSENGVCLTEVEVGGRQLAETLVEYVAIGGISLASQTARHGGELFQGSQQKFRNLLSQERGHGITNLHILLCSVAEEQVVIRKRLQAGSFTHG